MIFATIRFVLGFAAAVLAAGLVQVLFVAGPDLLSIDMAYAQALGLLMLLAAAQSAVFALPFAILAVLAAARIPIRSRLYFVAVGAAIAAGGFLTLYAGEGGAPTIFNRYALAAYVASGLVGGALYGLVAVRKYRGVLS